MANKILVLNGMSYAGAIQGLGDITYDDAEFIRNPTDFKLVLFTGGVDVSPDLYGETSPDNICYNSPKRDRHEASIFEMAFANGVLMAGICRGVQFLSVMAGGRLMHHLEGHTYGKHRMSINGGTIIEVNSLHHQMVIPHENSIIVGKSTERLSDYYVGVSDSKIDYRGPEVEAAIFPKTRSFGVQYHPEIMPKDSDGYQFFHKMVADALSMDWAEFTRVYEDGLNYDSTNEVHDAHGSVGR